MASSPLQLGFIGGGLDSAVGYAHFSASRLDGLFTLAAGCFSLEATINRKSALAYGVCDDRVYDTWQDLLRHERTRLDAVVILTPTPTHFEIVSACMKEGIPAICEKALATDVVQVEELVKIRDTTKAFLAVSYNYSGYPMVRELRSSIRNGKLGRIFHFQAEMPQEGFRRVDAQGNRPVPQTWRLSDGPIPTIHLDLAVHLHQLLYYALGERPLQVASDQGRYGWFDVVDNVTCLCRYSNDIQGHFWFSKSALGHRNGLRLRIYGSDASAEWFQASPEELALSFADGRRQILDRASSVELATAQRYNRFKAGHPAGFVEALANLYGDFADCVRQYNATGSWRSEEVFSVELAAEGLRLLEAMERSTRSRQWESV